MSLLIFLLLGIARQAISSPIVGQQCDWAGSGLSGGEKRGVRPIYLRCSEGKVSWSYPEGALRVLLRHSRGREFRACLRPNQGLAASVYLEGPRSLTKMYSPNSTTHVRCFQSRGGQAALYVEAATEPTIYKPMAEFAYDLQALPKGKGYDPNEECRPCTKDEMIQAFCTSELVTRGIIQRVVPVEDTDSSEIVVKVTKRLRSLSDWGGENDTQDQDDYSPDLERVGVGRHCGAAHGAGELVVMARRKLGQLVLTCAPRLAEWTALVRQPSVRDSAHCLLSS